MSFRSERMFLLGHIEKHIDEGSGHVARMQRLVADGERQRFNMTEAKRRLAEFLTAQAARQAYREQILRELGLVGSA
jgi:ferritin-like metal-binding protein YciE